MTEQHSDGAPAVSMTGMTAWVIGGSSGLGLSTAVALAELGAAVTISSRDPEKLESATNAIDSTGGHTARVIPLDVTNQSELEEAVDAWGEAPPDVVVMSGGGPPPSTTTQDVAGFDAAYRLLLRPAASLLCALGPRMAARGSGVIGFVTSSGVAEPIPGLVTSNVFRAGLTALAKSAAQELGPEGVRVMCFAPGRVATDRVATLDAMRAASAGRSIDEVKSDSVAAIPLGRYGTPQEFGRVVAFLTSPAGSYVTGVTISVDGGKSRGLLS